MQLVGHGIDLKRKHLLEVSRSNPEVDWFQLLTEQFLDRGGPAVQAVETIASRYPVVLHGVDLSIGSVDPLDQSYLASVRDLARRVGAVLISDHLSWSSHGGVHVPDLLPLPYTEEALEHVAARVHAVQEVLGQPLVLENPSSYFAYCDSTLTEWAFLAELAARTGCGILLDINNVVVTAHNFGFSAETYLAGIPVDAVRYFHLAGHRKKSSIIIDTHEGPIPEVVWALYAAAVRRFGRVPTLIEWDLDVPALDVMVAESRRAAAIEAQSLGANASRTLPVMSA